MQINECRWVIWNVWVMQCFHFSMQEDECRWVNTVMYEAILNVMYAANISKHKCPIEEMMINRPLSVRNDDAFSSHSEDKEIIIILKSL